MRSIFAATVAVAALAIATPASADHHAEGDGLATVLASETRGDDGARDKYRNPAETLAFFQIDPSMTVAEFGPGGGWYTRVLQPWISDRLRRASAHCWPRFRTRVRQTE